MKYKHNEGIKLGFMDRLIVFLAVMGFILLIVFLFFPDHVLGKVIGG